MIFDVFEKSRKFSDSSSLVIAVAVIKKHLFYLLLLMFYGFLKHYLSMPASAKSIVTP